MKKIIVILFFVFYSSISMAHLAHYNKYSRIEMEIFRNNKLIGYNYYFFNKNGDEMIIANEIKFSVKLLGKTIFNVEGYGEEKYIKNQLISFNSKTLQNDKKKFVDLIFDKKKNKFYIKGSSYNGEASIDNIVGNWWNHELLNAESQISPVSGSVKKQVITFIGNEKIELYGKTYDVEHYKLISKKKDLSEKKKLNFDIWFQKKTGLILKVKYLKMGEWEYRIKNFE
tara:strand:- start:5398 stop:6078 length:681 start_codon:yes stop_codon:yes gene_type:complete